MIGMHTQLGKLEAHSTPARLSTENRQARSNEGCTQATIDIDSYPSRHSYGYTNHDDFAKEHGQEGFASLKKTTSRRAIRKTHGRSSTTQRGPMRTSSTTSPITSRSGRLSATARTATS